MKIGSCWLYAISKYGYPPELKDAYRSIEEMANLGFKYIELEGVKEKNLLEIERNKENFKKLCDRLGLKIVNFCPVIPDLVSLDEEKRHKALELFKIGIGLANYFGCELIQTDSYVPALTFLGDRPYGEMVDFNRHFKVFVDPNFSWTKQWNVLVDSIKKCTSLARDAALRLCLEPRVGEMISNTDALLRLMDAVGNENLGAVFDTAHLYAQKEILPLSIEKLAKKIFYLHVADNSGLSNEHLGLGRGTIDWENVFAALVKNKFDGCVAIDVGRIPNIDEEMRNSKKFLEDLLSKMNIMIR